ncbi:hypothetical protein E2C01_023745 [Portunus trituberculatus]|uniref:Uncharacterized protein n=1 Tax=Portunus trituberculatus TaxID=210409 RepID=A0A5B7E9Y8_PORTR|nr:hypothetical protein [Portunus trituberculatus]
MEHNARTVKTDSRGTTQAAHIGLEGMESSEDGRVACTAVACMVGEQPLQAPCPCLTAAHEWAALITLGEIRLVQEGCANWCMLGIREANTGVGRVEAAWVVGGVAGIQGKGGHWQVMQELTLTSHTYDGKKNK